MPPSRLTPPAEIQARLTRQHRDSLRTDPWVIAQMHAMARASLRPQIPAPREPVHDKQKPPEAGTAEGFTTTTGQGVERGCTTECA